MNFIKIVSLVIILIFSGCSATRVICDSSVTYTKTLPVVLVTPETENKPINADVTYFLAENIAPIDIACFTRLVFAEDISSWKKESKGFVVANKNVGSAVVVMGEIDSEGNTALSMMLIVALQSNYVLKYYYWPNVHLGLSELKQGIADSAFLVAEGEMEQAGHDGLLDQFTNGHYTKSMR